MGTTALIVKLRQGLRQFGTAQGGNVVLTFALTLIPVMGFVGAAVDYSRANSAKAALQAAVDSTALMLSKDAQNLTTAQIQTKADAYFNALFKRPEVTNVVVTPTFTNPTQGSFKLDLTATGKVPTTFTKVFGQTNLNINVNSEVLWGVKKLEVALALDNTGSMSSSQKMTNLKTAAHNLLTTLKNAAKTNGDVKVAIIPFDTTVNLGTSYKNNNWFDIDSIDCNGWSSGSGCNSSNWKNYWEGCLRDRTYPYDVQDDPPNSSVTATLYPVYDCGSLTSLMPLSYDWTALNNKIDAMSPNGNTNVTIGLVWAWHALTAQAPLSEAAVPSPDLDKVIILLTDGDNTKSWKNSNNTDVTSQSSIDARTALACTNIKAAAIKLYTIRVIDGNASLLQSCATNPSMYFDVQQASQLNSVFTAIAQNLANLRIAK
jgi:Flp pilus assembly protein TadG